MIKKVYKSKKFVYSVMLLFIFLITSEAWSVNISHRTENDGKPVVRVKRGGKKIPAHQVERFEELFTEGKRLMQEEFDYEGAIQKFTEALRYAALNRQKADVYFYLSLAYYATLETSGEEKLVDVVNRIIELDYYRELDSNLLPPRYIEKYQVIKKDYGVLIITSNPSGADVYLDDEKVSLGKTPLTIAHREGDVKIRVKRGSKKVDVTMKVIAGQETATPEYVLKGKSSLMFILGGAAVLGGVAIAVLAGGGGNGNNGGGPPVATTGSIQVNSSPSGAQIFLDGSNTGEVTNTTLTDISPGSHPIKLVLDNYEDHEESVSVTAGQTATVSVTLTKHTITVTNPTKKSHWIKGKTVDIEWELGGSSVNSVGSKIKSKSGTGLDRNFLSSSKNRALRSGLGFRNLNLSRKNAAESASFGNETSESLISPRQNNAFRSHSLDRQRKVSANSEVSYRLDQRIPRFFPAFRSPSYQCSQHNAANNDVKPLEIERIKIELYKGNNRERTIVSDTSNDGKHLWTVAQSLEYGFDYKVRVLSASDSSLYGESDEFKITIPGYEYVAEWGGEGSGKGKLNKPNSVAVYKSGQVYVGDHRNDRIQKFDSNGNYITEWDIEYPNQIAIDNSGNVYVAHYGYIQKFGSGGRLLAERHIVHRLHGVALDRIGNIYISNYNDDKIYKLKSDLTGNIKSWGSRGAGKYQLNNPRYLAVDSKNNLYVADYGNWRIVKYDSDGNYILEWKVPAPSGVAVDSLDMLFVSSWDIDANLITVFDSNGTKLLEWGNPGLGDYSYDLPYGLAIDTSGYLYIADCNNHRIVKYRQQK